MLIECHRYQAPCMDACDIPLRGVGDKNKCNERHTVTLNFKGQAASEHTHAEKHMDARTHNKILIHAIIFLLLFIYLIAAIKAAKHNVPCGVCVCFMHGDKCHSTNDCMFFMALN